VEGHHDEEEPARFEHAVDLAEERLGPLLEVLRDVRRERGVEAAVAVRRLQRVGTHQLHVGIMLARHAQRPPAVVDGGGAFAQLREQRQPGAGAAARFEDAEPAATEELPEDRRRHLVLLDGREVDVVVLPAGRALRPVLLGVRLVEAVGDLFAEKLLEAHGSLGATGRTGRSPRHSAFGTVVDVVAGAEPEGAAGASYRVVRFHVLRARKSASVNPQWTRAPSTAPCSLASRTLPGRVMVICGPGSFLLSTGLSIVVTSIARAPFAPSVRRLVLTCLKRLVLLRALGSSRCRRADTTCSGASVSDWMVTRGAVRT